MTTPPLVDRGKPIVVHVPTYQRSRGNVTHALLDELGLTSMPWHELVLRHSMAIDSVENWLVSHVAVLVPWLDEKDHLARLRMIYGAAVLAERVVHVSGSLSLASERFRVLLDVVQNSKVLNEITYNVRQANGEQQIEFQGGGVIRFRARNQHGGGARGHSADLLVIDDARSATYDTVLRDHMPTLLAAKHGPHIWWVDNRDERGPREPHGPYPALLERALMPAAAPVLYLGWVSLL